MTLLSREANLVQNPGLGAVLLWRFACGYTEQHASRGYAPLPTIFLVLPLVLHTDSFTELASTRTGLRGFAEKFGASKDPRSDMVLAIHNRVSSWRDMTMNALKLALQARLATIVPADATVMPLSETAPSKVPTSTKPLLSNAEKLGAWVSSLSLFEISTILKLRF